MSEWNEAEKRSNQATSEGGIFLRLPNDGDKFVGVFVGKPEWRELAWNEKASRYEDFGPEHTAQGKKPTARFAMNVFVPDHPKDPSSDQGSLKVFEMNNQTFTSIRAVKDKYGLETWMFEVTRNGVKNSQKVSYTVLPEEKIAAALQAKVKSLVLHDLKKVLRSDGDTAGSDMNSFDKKNDPEALIDPDTSAALVARVKTQPKVRIEEFLKTFGIQQVKALKASQVAAAQTLLDQWERPAPASPQNNVPAEVDPFA